MNIHLSHWERESWTGQCDFLVIGSGIVGLSAALRLKELHPKAEIRVLERGNLPTGASTKNAGFACFGSVSELLDDLSHHDTDTVLQLVTQRWQGLARLRERLGDTALEYEPVSGYELFRPADEALYAKCAAAIPRLNQLIAPIVGKEQVYRLDAGRIADFGFAGVAHLIENTREGLLNTGKMMRSLLRKVQAAGVLVLTGAEVTALESQTNHVEVQTRNNWQFRAGNVIVATNGFASQLLPQLSVQPARAQVLITKPISDLRFKGGFHYDRGYYYFRNVGNRILFGGGRNLNIAGETTTEINLTDQIQGKLEEILRTVILPNQTFEIEHRWAGIMGVGSQKSYLLERVQPRVCCAVRLGGMGVAIGTLVGEEAADFILS